MKKLVCAMLIVVLGIATCVNAFAVDVKYMYYNEAIVEMQGIFADFAADLEEQTALEGDISDVEFMMFFDYLRIWLDLNEVSSLQRQALVGKQDISDVEVLISSNNLFKDIIEERYAAWENGEELKADIVIGTWKFMEPMMQPAEE